MEARYYNPSIGRFLSQDPAFWNVSMLPVQLADPQSWNSYSYARNNPIVLKDPDGQFWDTVVDLGFLAYDSVKFLINSTKAIEAAVSEKVFTAVGMPNIAAQARADKQYYSGKIASTSANLGLSVAGTAIPFAPVAGIKAVQKVEKGIDVAASARQAGVAEVSPLLSRGLSQWDDIIDPARQTHILRGDPNGSGGGHAFGAGRGKSEFPQSWSDNDILRNTADIATDPNTKWIRQRNGRYYGEGIRDGVRTGVVLNSSKSKVITSYPRKNR